MWKTKDTAMQSATALGLVTTPPPVPVAPFITDERPLASIVARAAEYRARVKNPLDTDAHWEIYRAFVYASFEQLQENRDLIVELCVSLPEANRTALLETGTNRERFWFKVLTQG